MKSQRQTVLTPMDGNPKICFFKLNTTTLLLKFQVPYARSQMHLLDLSEKICDNFEDYAQAKFKSNGKPTVIRLTTPEGNMNPDFPKVHIYIISN